MKFLPTLWQLRFFPEWTLGRSHERLVLVVESFTCDEARRHTICNSLNILPARWKLLWTYKKDFVEGRKNYQSFDFVVDAIRRREFGILKSSLQGWVDSRKCISDETLFSQARICMVRCSLVWLKHHWDPSINIKWFNSTLLHGRKRPTKKFRTLFEWVENEIQQHGEI